MSDASWLAARRSGIGASEIAAVLGLSPYQSRYQLWADKAGLLPHEVAETEAMAAGKLLEPVIAEMVRRRRGWPVELNGQRISWSPDHPWLFATLDAIAHDDQRGPGVLELKAASAFAEGWDGDRPPLHYRLQVAQQMLATGLRWGAVACFDGPTLGLKLWEVSWSDPLAARIVQEGQAFWALVEEARELVARGQANSGRLRDLELALGPGARDLAAVRRLHTEDSGDPVDLSEHMDLLREWAVQQSLAGDARKQALAAKAQAMVLAGSANQIVADGRRVARRTQKGAWRLNPDFRQRSYALAISQANHRNPKS